VLIKEKVVGKAVAAAGSMAFHMRRLTMRELQLQQQGCGFA
jgi:hypothetical protein